MDTPATAQSAKDRTALGTRDFQPVAARIRETCTLIADRLREQNRPSDAVDLLGACDTLTDLGTTPWHRDTEGRWAPAVTDVATAGQPQLASTPAAAARTADTLPMPSGPPPIVVVDGVDPPWLLGEILRKTDAKTPVDNRSCIIATAMDWNQIVIAAACEQAHAWLTDPRVHLFAGERASGSFASWLDTRSAYNTSGSTIGTASSLSPVGASILEQLSHELRRKTAEDAELRQTIRTRDDARDAAYWGSRFRDTSRPADRSEPLRVLVITTRYSTYVGHAARGLTEVLNKAGHHATLLLEPDTHTRMSSVAYLRAIDETDPDLIVTINYQRRRLGDFIPAGIPYVTWTQDAMPHLFNASTPVTESRRDFVIGHLERALFPPLPDASNAVDRAFHPTARAACVPVLTSEFDFHEAPIPAADRERFACDVAWISNHGQPPQQLSDTILDDAKLPATQRALIESLGRDIQAFVIKPGLHDRPALIRFARDRLLNAGFSQADTEQIILAYAMPLAERTVRHQTAAWARDICGRKGWRMRIFGLGWEDAPGFAHLAEGPIEHGAQLRAAYASAAATPHVNLGSTLHQRIFECAMSGGLPLCRRTEADVRFEWKAALRAVLRRTNAEVAEHTATEFPFADHSEFMHVAAQQQRLGHPVESHTYSCLGPEADQLRHDIILKSLPALSSVLGDLSQTTFASEHEFEALLERAIESPEWRVQLSRGIAERARARFSLSSMANTMISLVRDSLEHESTS